jgi:hypothetical protein
MKSLNVYTCNEFRGRYPVGAAAIIVAENEQEAVKLLEAELTKDGLTQTINLNQLELVAITKPQATILCNGEY